VRIVAVYKRSFAVTGIALLGLVVLVAASIAPAGAGGQVPKDAQAPSGLSAEQLAGVAAIDGASGAYQGASSEAEARDVQIASGLSAEQLAGIAAIDGAARAYQSGG